MARFSRRSFNLALLFAVAFVAPHAVYSAADEKEAPITLADASLGHIPLPIALPAPKLVEPALSMSSVKSEAPVQGIGVYPVYTEGYPEPGFFVPSGAMGDVRDLAIYPASTVNPAVGKTCMKISYSAEGSYNYQWAGLFWQLPAPAAGVPVGSKNFSAMSRLTFWARGVEGGEVIDFFKVGATNGRFQDSGTAQIGPVELTREWKKYTIDLTGIDRRSIAHPFGWTVGFFDNPHGATFFLDEIQFER